MTLSEEMREYLFRLSEHEPVTRPEAGWPDAVAELEAENAELREELAAVLYVAVNRGETLGYEDEDYRERMRALDA